MLIKDLVSNALCRIVNHVQMVIIVAEHSVTVVDRHAAQRIGICISCPDLRAGRAVKLIADSSARAGIGVEIEVVRAGAVALHNDRALNRHLVVHTCIVGDDLSEFLR